MARRFKILFFSLISCVAVTEPAPLSLSDAVSEALRDSPENQIADSQASKAHWKKVQAYSGFLPSLSVDAIHLTNEKWVYTDLVFGGGPVSVPGILPTSSVILNAKLPIFDGFASTQKLRSAFAFQKAADNEASWAKFKIRRQVILQFYKALAAQALNEVARQNLKTLEDHLKDVKLFKRAGVSTNFDVLRVDVQFSEAKSEVLSADDNFYAARAKLSELLGHEADHRPLQGALPVMKGNLIDHQDFETKERQDIRAIADRAKGASLASSAENKFWVPRVSLFGQYNFYNNLNNSAFDGSAYRNAYMAGIMLNWNIFDGMSSIAKAGEAVEEKIQSEKNLQIAGIKAAEDLDFWKRKYKYFCSVYDARESNIDKSAESVRLAKAGRRFGSKTSSELLDAETDLFKARAGAVNSQLGAIEALINLELTTGKELYDFR